MKTKKRLLELIRISRENLDGFSKLIQNFGDNQQEAKLYQLEQKYFGNDMAWRKKSSNARTRIGLAQSLMPLVSMSKERALRYAVLRTERVRDAVKVCYSKLRKKFKKVPNDKISKGSFVNVSQCVSRLCVTRGHLPTFTTSAKFYSYERDVVLTGHCAKTNTSK